MMVPPTITPTGVYFPFLPTYPNPLHVCPSCGRCRDCGAPAPSWPVTVEPIWRIALPGEGPTYTISYSGVGVG